MQVKGVDVFAHQIVAFEGSRRLRFQSFGDHGPHKLTLILYLVALSTLSHSRLPC